MHLTADELRRELDAIARGDVTLTVHGQDPQDVVGDCEYETSNGWTLNVFNDAGEWDYLASARTPDGRTIRFEELDEPFASELVPSAEVAWVAYGIPVDIQWRCPSCGGRTRGWNRFTRAKILRARHDCATAVDKLPRRLRVLPPRRKQD